MFTLRKFADIKHHLPPDCWCRQRREFAAGGFDDEWVLHASGPVQLAQLDLAPPTGTCWTCPRWPASCPATVFG